VKNSIEKEIRIIESLLKKNRSKSPSFKVAIVSTPRCGSTMFCDTLEKTELFGWPEEWFHDHFIKAYESVLQKKFDYKDYLDLITKKTTTDNGLFSANFHVNHYIYFKERGIDLLDLDFDKVFYLQRNDKISQAISLTIARITGQWTQHQPPANTVTEIDVSHSSIINNLHEIMLYEEFYQENLKHYVNREYGYESFTKNSGDFLDILTQCKVPISEKHQFYTSLKIQRNQLNDLIRSKLFMRLGITG